MRASTSVSHACGFMSFIRAVTISARLLPRWFANGPDDPSPRRACLLYDESMAGVAARIDAVRLMRGVI